MELSKQKDSLFDPFRKTWVVAHPEELVRQKLLYYMTTQLGFPRSLLSVEISLSQVPHLRGVHGLPKRRADILCFAKKIHPKYPLYPLLLIECKEGKIKKEARSQVLGYNHFVQASFVGIAGENQIELLYPETLPYLPSYAQLMESVCS